MYRQNIRNFSQGQQEGLAIYRIIITMYHFLIILNVMQDAEYQRGAYKILKSFMDNLLLYFNPISSLVAFDCMRGEFTEDGFY